MIFLDDRLIKHLVKETVTDRESFDFLYSYDIKRKKDVLY